MTTVTTDPTALPAMKRPIDDLPMVYLRALRIHAINEPQCIDVILNEIDVGRGGFVVTVNLDHTRRCFHEPWYMGLVNQADLVVADGKPLLWAAKLSGQHLPARVAGSDLISSLSAAAAKRNASIFLLGGDPGTADKAANVLRQRHTGLQVAGTSCPPFGFEKSEQEMAKLREALHAASPDIVFVALGSPKQEKLIAQLQSELPAAWWLGVGISFSFLTGDVKRAPKWMQKVGVEWLHRLMQEPKRLFKRYLLQGIPFGLRLLGEAFVKRGRFRRPS